MKNLYIISIFLLVALSCGKDSTTSTSNQANATANISIDAQSEGKPLIVNTFYKLNNTDSILISRLDFYVQNFVLNSGDSLTNLKLYSLFDSANIKYQYVSKTPALNINRIAFMSGLTSQTNNIDPNTQSVSSALGGNKNMYWTGWTKYRYVVLEGIIKTPDTSYNVSYHTGLTFRGFTDIAKTIQIPQGSSQAIKIHLNINKVFYPSSGSNINYRTGETGGHSNPSEEALMNKFAGNFGNAFSVE